MGVKCIRMHFRFYFLTCIVNKYCELNFFPNRWHQNFVTHRRAAAAAVAARNASCLRLSGLSRVDKSTNSVALFRLPLPRLCPARTVTPVAVDPAEKRAALLSTLPLAPDKLTPGDDRRSYLYFCNQESTFSSSQAAL